MSEKFYISTAIPYVNGAPHIGHALEFIQADAVARYQRLLGKEVFFVSGTDENSLKNVQAAEKAGETVIDFVSKNAEKFKDIEKMLNISFDDFIRTTEDRHFEGAKKLWKLCEKDIYKKTYKGLYCVGCEAFYSEEDLVDGLCPEHKTKPELIEEENYFFKLSNYQKQIKDILEKDELKIIPTNRKNEVLAFVERGLEDFSVSRSVKRARGWGVPVPNDESQIMYVWFDALSNYINALDFGGDAKKYAKFWLQEENNSRSVVHVLGKGIARFHAIYWIGMLLSAGVPLPTIEFIHGYLTVNGEKISKSLGNVISPEEVTGRYGVDGARYYFLGAISAYQDGDFSFEKCDEYYNANLVNGVGNLTSRILTMAEKYSNNLVPPLSKDPFDLDNFWTNYHQAFQNFDFQEVIKNINNLVSSADTLISNERPWEQVKNGKDISPTIYALLEVLRHIALALLPIIPSTAKQILLQLNIPADIKLNNENNWGKLEPETKINKTGILFPRLT